MSLTAVTLGESAFTRPENTKEPTGSQSGTIPPQPEDWGILVVFWVKGKIDDDGYIQECDDESANRIIEDWIRENFGD